jgi:vitamin B12 transporter
MKIRSLRLPLAVLPMALSAASAVFAQNQTPNASPLTLKETVVTATRSETRTDELISDVVVIDRAAIEAISARTLPELLSRAAGLQMTANGGAGKSSSVFIRGTEARHTILLIDGVRYGSATLGTPIWEAVPVALIERIEVVKGPASALYGSDGVGGVVQVFTRKNVKGVQPRASVTLGSARYRQVTAGVSGGQGPLSYGLDVLHSRDNGFSAANSNVPFSNFNPDDDPFNQSTVNASLAYKLSTDWTVDAGILNSTGTTFIDEGLGRNAQTAVRSEVLRLGVLGTVMAGWKSELRYARSQDQSNAQVAKTLPSDFTTRQNQWTWQNTVDTPLGIVLAGLEQSQQEVSGSTAYTVTNRSINSAFVGIHGSEGRHSWQVNLRRDNNSQFGGSTTGFAGYGFRMAEQWRLQASHGTSFVAPSFNQLYFPGFGNAALQPERGKNTDLGLTWSSGHHEVKLVYFNNKIRGYISNTTLPQNIPRTQVEGWRVGYNGKLGNFDVSASHDALQPRNELNGLLLPRRATEQTTLALDYNSGPWRMGGSLLLAGSRFDNAANTRILNGYNTLDLHADYQVSADWTVQARINNLTNKRYETAYGYNQQGRALFVTLRWQPTY